MSKILKITKIEQACLDIIFKEKRYITKSKLAKLINVPRTTISSLGIDTDKICEKFGYFRSTLKPKGDVDTRNKFIESVKEGYISYLQRVQHSAPLYEYLNFLKLTDIQKSKYYRYDLDVVGCHNKAGIRYIKNHGLDCENAQLILRKLIVNKNRYVTELELSTELKVSRALLTVNKNNINLATINLEYGFTRNLRSFESMIGEWLTEYFPNEIIEREKSFKNLKSPISKRGILRFDYYLPNLKLMVEVDGPCHWDPNYIYYSKEVILKDEVKNKFCKDKNLRLIRINYSEKYSKSDFKNALSGIPLKLSVGQPAAEPV